MRSVVVVVAVVACAAAWGEPEVSPSPSPSAAAASPAPLTAPAAPVAPPSAPVPSAAAPSAPPPSLVSTAPRAAEPPIAWSIVGGVAAALLPLGVGGGLLTTNDHDLMTAGIYVVMSGLVLAPVVSHAIAREWGRAAVFAALPTASLLGMVWLLQDRPQVLWEGNKHETRVAFAVLLSASVLTSAGGLVDSFWAGERARARARKTSWIQRLAAAPLVARDFYGLAVGGSF